MRRALLICWIGLLVLGSQVSAQTVNLASLLDEMIDRDNLARFPVARVHVPPGQQLRSWYGGPRQAGMVCERGSQPVCACG